LTSALSLAAGQGIVLIRIEEPFSSHSLAGTLLDPSGGEIDGVLVQDCREGWKDCFAQQETNTDGRFSWPRSVSGKHFLRISKSGFNPMEIVVIVDKKVKTDLRLRMDVST
jgi:hypothetical protein